MVMFRYWLLSYNSNDGGNDEGDSINGGDHDIGYHMDGVDSSDAGGSGDSWEW
jgi:hypothetical protein